MSKNILKFPKNFLWGTATSGHQIEGNNTNSDWWYFENHKKKGQEYPLERSGIACDSYNRYEEDFDLCVMLNNNAARISIEWARIEPKKGEFDIEAINHYKNVLEALKKRNLKTFVTLHHFSNPLWFTNLGGWTNFKSEKYFSRYAQYVAENLGPLIDFFATVNEPQVLALMSYTRGQWPPYKINLISSLLCQINFIRSHIAAYKAIKSVHKHYVVGIVSNVVNYETESHILDVLLTNILNFLNRDFFHMPIIWAGAMDFFGLNFYFSERLKHFRAKNPNDIVSDLGWWIDPAGIEKVLEHLKRYNVPIYITENGLADAKDEKRVFFIKEMLRSIHKSIKAGIDVRGYFHWSLIDNYEWHHGFWPRFGLVEIDRENNLKRIPRKSFYYYANICKYNEINLDLSE